MEWLGYVADVVGLAGAVFALLAWLKARQLRQDQEKEKERQNKKIKVFLQSTTHRIELPFEMRRAEFTRAEVLGRIGMIPTKNPKERFRIEYLNTRDFLLKVNAIMDGAGDATLEIKCTDEELGQFDLTHFEHLFNPI
jgi:hypothetical protein